MSIEKTALITGASSGFGLLTTVALAKRGWHVVATMRDLSRRDRLEAAAKEANVLDKIEFAALDVTNSGQVAAVAAEMAKRPQPLDALINNAGFAMAGFAEDVSDGELRKQFDTNFFGAAAVTRALLPQFKQQGSGYIVMVSSVSGRMGFPGGSSYAASKFALEGWSETLRFELKPMGIHVVLVEPGAFETDIWTRNADISEGTRALQADPDSAGAARLTRWRSKMETGKPRANPQHVADLIAAILRDKNPGLRYAFGTDAWLGLMLRRLLPWSLFENLIIRQTGLSK